MNIKNIIDQHVHSDNSFDGNHNVMFICEKAIEAGLRGITFTDHCELDYDGTNFRKITVPSYVETIEARHAFVGNLIVRTGIEIGQGIYRKELADEIISSLNYDFILGSLHSIEPIGDFYYLDYSKHDESEMDGYLEIYFKKLLETAQWNQFDSLAHITYPLRYIVGENHMKVNMKLHDEIIDEILKTLAYNGKALEINTSGLRQPINDTVPNARYVKRFKELGGEFITVGSDSHFAYDVGKGCEKGLEIAYEAGFRRYALYENREPVMIDIK